MRHFKYPGGVINIVALDKSYLKSIGSDKPKIHRFLSRLLEHYEALSSSQKKRDFLNRILAWSEEEDKAYYYWYWQNKPKGLFAYAQFVDHDEALKLLMTTRIYKPPSKYNALRFQPNYYKHLKSAYLNLKAPFRDSVIKALQNIKIPAVLAVLIFEYALPKTAPIREAIAIQPLIADAEKEEQDEQKEEAVALNEPQGKQPMSFFCRRQAKGIPENENPERILEDYLQEKYRKEVRKKWLFSLLLLFMAGLALSALTAAGIALMVLAFPLIPYTAVVVFGILLSGLLLWSTLQSLFSIFIPLLRSLTLSLCGPKDRSRFILAYHEEKRFTQGLLLSTLGAMALISLVVFALGLIALLPPLALSIPILAWTIIASVTMVGSTSALGFFASKAKKEKVASRAFGEVLSNCANEAGQESQTSDLGCN